MKVIETVRMGSCHEYLKWNRETGENETSLRPKRGYSHRVREEYKTVFHDCLPGKEWIEAHWKDEYPEPTIDIMVNDKSLHLNGNYKKGSIQGFMADFTEKKRAGRKVMTVSKGDEVVNCGGGVYLPMHP